MSNGEYTQAYLTKYTCSTALYEFNRVFFMGVSEMHTSGYLVIPIQPMDFIPKFRNINLLSY